MRKHQLLLAIIILLLAAVLAVPKIFFVPRVAQALKEHFQVELAAEAVDVQLHSPWGFELLVGRISRLNVAITKASFENLSVEEVTIKGEQIRFDPRALFKETEFIYLGAENLETELKVTERALNEFFWEEVDPERILKLTVQPEGVSLGGEISVWNMDLELRVDGVLEVWQDSVLRFVPGSLAVKDALLPSFVLEMLNENYGIGVDFGVFPYPIVISDVVLQDGQMIIGIGVVE